MNGYQFQQDKPHHYYGDLIRKLLVAAAVIMLIGLPVFNDRLPVPAPVSIIAILTLGLFAGLTNPRKMWVIIVETIISVFGLAIFEYYAVTVYQIHSSDDLLFWFNQILAIIFFVALYYSTKTWRASMVDYN